MMADVVDANTTPRMTFIIVLRKKLNQPLAKVSHERRALSIAAREQMQPKRMLGTRLPFC
jgi:hypothetical protein